MITVKRAYLELEREGVIVTRQGRGSFIADDADLSMSLQEEELDEHLAAALDLADLLGLGERELEVRLARIRTVLKRQRT